MERVGRITIGSVCDVKTGKLDANASNENGTYPFFTCSKEPLRINTFSYDAECVLIAGNGDLNVKYYNGKFDAYQRTYIIALKTGITNISVRYLFAFFSLYVETLRRKSIGGVIKYIKLGDITEAKIPIPPLQEQERIVAELDLLTGIIDKQKQQLKELDTLAQSIFYDMFGSPDANEKEWIMKSLAEIGTIVSGSTPSTSDESNWDGDVNWVTPAELGVQLFYGETRRKITSKAAKSLTIMPIGTLLMSSRAPIGKLAITSVPMCCNQGFKNIVCGNNVNNIYLYYCLMLNINSIKAMGRGATFKEVSKQAVSSFEIMLPPMNLQEPFAQKILSIESQKKSINRSIAESQKLFDYTMDKYFG